MLKAICENWGTTGSHRFPVHFDENSGCIIQLPTATCELLALPDHLDVRLSLENREDQDRMEKVVEEHVKRFAFREELQFVWDRAE